MTDEHMIRVLTWQNALLHALMTTAVEVLKNQGGDCEAIGEAIEKKMNSPLPKFISDPPAERSPPPPLQCAARMLPK